MAKSQRRGRSTKLLLQLVHERFHACQYCLPDWVTDYTEDLFKRLRLRKNEARRLRRVLVCPHCESDLDLLDEIVSYDLRQLAEKRRHQRWAEEYAKKF